jgi:hypothetical protein
MNINWKTLPDQSYEGFDENGNRYRQPANMETTTVFLKDGRTGQGWTPEKAVQEAESKTLVTSKDHEVRVQHGPRYDYLKKPARIESIIEQMNPSIQHPVNIQRVENGLKKLTLTELNSLLSILEKMNL